MKSEDVWQICKDFEYELWSESGPPWSSSYETTQYSRIQIKLIKPVVVDILGSRDLLLFL
jgi:hypothetical protein